MTCLFCAVPKSEIVVNNKLCFARWDKFPVSPGHLLIIPKRHFDNFFNATPEEIMAAWELMGHAKHEVEKNHQPDGYNVGVNVGTAGGQSVFHVHIHVIPRYEGDVENPFGGVRGVIPLNREY